MVAHLTTDDAALGGAKLSSHHIPMRIIVKIGSSLLVNADGSANVAWLKTLAHDVAKYQAAGHNIIIVSSGAVALGAKKLGMNGRDSLTDSQACAAVGQIILAGIWTEILQAEGLIAAQTLLTLDDLEDRRRYLNISTTLERLVQAGVIPIINENDSVATNEIRYGDNDRLAARVAQASHAHKIILLSDVDGLYDRNPSHPDAQIVTDIHAIDDNIRNAAQNASSSGMGSGGMASKIEAAHTAMTSGIDLIIASGKRDYPLSAIENGGLHSMFHKDESSTADKGQRKWLNGRLRSSGTLTIDNGAANALMDGASLLAIGVTKIEGDFDRGDVIDIVSDDSVIARGLSEYDNAETMLIAGKNKEEIESLLSYPPRSALVHRNHMVIL